MSLVDMMSTELVTVPLGVTLDAAVDEMLGNHVGSVLVVDDDEPVGIITETDVLAAGSGTERPYGDIPVSRAMSPNIVTIEPDASAEAAIERMQEYGIKKLAVTEEGTLSGIVTTTDLVVHRTDLAEEVTAIDRRQSYPDT
jgi:CBS domain-containing protein